MPLNLVDRCRQSVRLICVHLRSHCHYNLKSHIVFIFSFVSAMRIKTLLYENQQSSVKCRVFCMFGGSSNCVWARNLSFKYDELPSCRWNWIWISSCEFVCVGPCVLCMGITLVTVYDSCLKIRDLLLILFECACLLDSSEEWHWVIMCNTETIVIFCFCCTIGYWDIVQKLRNNRQFW
jgi:hypothetical protein